MLCVVSCGGSHCEETCYVLCPVEVHICKLLERLIKDHMVDFLLKHKLLNSSQHGFFSVVML